MGACRLRLPQLALPGAERGVCVTTSGQRFEGGVGDHHLPFWPELRGVFGLEGSAWCKDVPRASSTGQRPTSSFLWMSKVSSSQNTPKNAICFQQGPCSSPPELRVGGQLGPPACQELPEHHPPARCPGLCSPHLLTEASGRGALGSGRTPGHIKRVVQ
jgi:hypothetical protein